MDMFGWSTAEWQKCGVDRGSKIALRLDVVGWHSQVIRKRIETSLSGPEMQIHTMVRLWFWSWPALEMQFQNVWNSNPASVESKQKSGSKLIKLTDFMPDRFWASSHGFGLRTFIKLAGNRRNSSDKLCSALGVHQNVYFDCSVYTYADACTWMCISI